MPSLPPFRRSHTPSTTYLPWLSTLSIPIWARVPCSTWNKCKLCFSPLFWVSWRIQNHTTWHRKSPSWWAHLMAWCPDGRYSWTTWYQVYFKIGQPLQHLFGVKNNLGHIFLALFQLGLLDNWREGGGQILHDNIGVGFLSWLTFTFFYSSVFS